MMETSNTTSEMWSRGTFAEKVAIELNRAERYRVFVSLTVLDLGSTGELAGDKATEVLDEVATVVKESVRACDSVAVLHGHCLAVLQPETPRQGAEISANRLAELVKGRLIKQFGEPADRMIPVEIASFPDTAGARTLAGFLEELVHKSRN